MAIEKSNRYSTDTQGNVQSSTPLVVIYKGVRSDNIDEIDTILDSDKLFISTSNIYFDNNYYEPLLKKTPSVKQTIDTEHKKFRTKIANIDIINSEFHGRTFSDNVNDIVNCAVRIYYKTQSCKTLDDCMLIAQSTITRYTQKKDILTLYAEDLTELILSKTIPELAEGLEYALDDRLKPIPIVYGHVKKSPVLKKINPLLSDSEGNSVVSSLVLDSKPVYAISVEQTTENYPSIVSHWFINSAIYIHDENYLNLINQVPNEYTQIPNIDTTIPFFELAGNQVLITEQYFNFQNVLSEDEQFKDLDLKTPMMSRMLRKFVELSGQKMHSYYTSPYNRITQQHLFSTTQNNVDSIFELSDDVPELFHTNMFNNDNYYIQSEAHFPFESDQYNDWSIDIYDQKDTPIGDFPKSDLLKNWNVPDTDGNISIFNVQPNNYIDYIKNNDTKGLVWSGVAPQDYAQDSAYVNFELILDDTGLDNKCISWFVGQVTQWKNPNLTYGDFASGMNWIGGTVIWGNTVDVPVAEKLQVGNIPFNYGALPQDEQDAWKHWNTIAPVQNSPQINRTDEVIGNRNISTYSGTVVPEWNTISQLESIKIGQPKYDDFGGGTTDSYHFTTGSLNYMHFIQDAFIEKTHTKDWYVNVKGRINETYTDMPFNSWELQTIPPSIDYDDYTQVFDYIKSIGYSINFGSDEDTSGGSAGWLINTESSMGFATILESANITTLPNYAWILDANGNTAYYEQPNWNTSMGWNISQNTPFIIFADIPIRIPMFQVSGQTKLFFRMNHIVGTDNDWEQDYTPEDLDSKISEYLDKGFLRDIYTPELTGMVDSPALVMQDLIINESDYTIDNFVSNELQQSLSAHQGWKMAFTLNEQIKIKELIQDLSTNTKLYPRFSTNGKFSFTTLKDFYNATDINFHIKKHDVLDYSFDTTKIEDVKSRYGVLYEYDYATKDYNKLVSKLSIKTQNEDKYLDYKEITEYLYSNINNTPDNFIYDIKKLYNKTNDESSEEFEAKYIRTVYTAEKLRKHLLMDRINQHLKINLTLNNKYINTEIGDIIYLDQLSDKLGLGNKYWAYEVKGGQLLYPFFMVTDINKSNDKINLKLRRLHRLQYGLPLWLIENILLDSDYVLPNNFNDISKIIDDGDIYNHTLQNLTANFEPEFDDYEKDINNDFVLQWFPNDSSYVISGEEGSAIRLDVLQSEEYGEEAEDWTAEIEEDGNYTSGDTTNFEFIKYSDSNNNYNGYVIIKSKNDSDVNRNGSIRITTSLGRKYHQSFLQTPIIDEEEVGDGAIVGDVNGDGVVNVLDIVQQMQMALGNQEATPEADLNGDGGVNIQDIVILLNLILE